MDVVTQPPGPAARDSFLRRAAAAYRRHLWPVTAALTVLVLAAGFAGLQVNMHGRVAAGVHAGPVALGGLSAAQAQAALAQTFVPAVSAVRLRAGGRTFVTSLSALGIRLDAPAMARQALAFGRRRVAGLSLWLPGGGGAITPVLRVDAAALAAGLKPIAKAADLAPRDATLRLRARSVTVVPARDGEAVDQAALVAAVRAAVLAGRPFSGAVPLRPAPPQVSTAAARSRAAAAAVYLQAPLTLRLRTASVTLSPGRLAGLLSVTHGGEAQNAPLTFDNAHARAVLHRLFAASETAPVNATITPLAKGGIRVSQSSDGLAVDMDQLVADMDQAAAAPGLRTVYVALGDVPPQLSSDDVQTSGLATVGSQFVTYFDPRNSARVANIQLAARLVDGAVVAPGAVFSLNATLGPRTMNRGFDYAPVIAADNVLRQGVGGGVCQYATTLFNAVFFAGLPVVERHNHSLFIAHYPIGRDATVSWGSADFKFRNDTRQALTIRSWVDGAALTVAVVGKTGRTVTTATSPFYDVRKPAHGRADPRLIYDSDLAQGITRWEQGEDGRSVRVTRTVRDVRGSVLFHDVFTSVYEPMDWIKRVGTG